MKNQSNGQESSTHLPSLAHGRAVNPVKALQRVSHEVTQLREPRLMLASTSRCACALLLSLPLMRCRGDASAGLAEQQEPARG